MLRSLFAGVSGLRNHQVRMDVIGNNVANVNTVAFKAGRVTFKEGFAQLVQGASRPPGDQGGTNPIQVGLGSQIGSIDTLFTQGNLETTGMNTDMAIQGESFFVVAKGAQHYYTRSGNFQLDADGRLVSPTNGFVVQGRTAVNGKLSDTIGDIKLPFGQKTSASATTKVSLAGNLDASSAPFTGNNSPPTAADALDPLQRANAANKGSYQDLSITVYDSQGTKHDLKMVMWKTGAAGDNTWDWDIDASSMPEVKNLTTTGTHPFTFKADGTLDTTGFTNPKISFDPLGAASMSVTLDPGSGVNGLSQFASVGSAVMRDQDGYGVGTLENFTIDRTGTIVGAFTNGTTAPLGQVVLADFNNPSGLQRVGDNMYSTSGNSGGAVLGYALEGSQSSITSGALEMSNVDLAQEFTNMIVAERGFQANGRVITTSDQMLEELVSLKR
ncbi:MAG TPA: flagellar hook protein FlgE [Gemmatimonadaceae bacterium]